MTRRRVLPSIVALGLCTACLAAGLPGATASAATRAVAEPPGAPERPAPGITVTRDTTGDLPGGGSLLPDPLRLDRDVGAGERVRLGVGFRNGGGRSVTLQLSARELGERDAASWLRVPAEPFVLDAGERVDVAVGALVPTDAEPGSAHALVVATVVATVEPAGRTGPTGRRVVRRPATVELHLIVRGEARSDGRVVDGRAQRIAWHGLDDGPLTTRFTWRNTGAISAHVRGSIRYEGPGSGVLDTQSLGRTFIRRGEMATLGTMHDRWPWVGRVTPVVRVEVDGGPTSTVRLAPVWVLPAWWMLLGGAAAIALTVAGIVRRRRRWRQIVARARGARPAELAAPEPPEPGVRSKPDSS